MDKLKGLKPERVFYYFEEISKIPRGSGNTKEISNYLVKFAKDNGLDYIQEKIGNVIIYKKAFSGYEEAETVILQGHMDMVCEKNGSSDHDFIKEGIKLLVKNDYIYAKETTLGADDGIALAYMLAILEDKNCKHPAIEAVFTVDEETGMDGALMLDTINIKGTRIINLDSEEEGILWSSCAGGVRCECKIPVEYEKTQPLDEGIEIQITGLKGGHSGTEIDKNRINANCLLGEILFLTKELFNDSKEVDGEKKSVSDICFKIAEISGGMKDNAIPREARAIIHIPSKERENIINILKSVTTSIMEDNKAREDKLNIEIKKASLSNKNFDEESTNKAILLLNLLPNGVVAMSADIENLVETSLNIGVMSVKEQNFTLDLSLRSSVRAAKARLRDKVKYITKNLGGICEVSGDYPAWEYKKESVLRDTFSHAFYNMYGKKMEILALHAGLECGILTDKLQGADCVSIGPDIYDIHTPKEKMSIKSVERTYNLLLKVLEKL